MSAATARLLPPPPPRARDLLKAEVAELRARVAELEAQLVTTRFVAELRTPPAPREPRHGWDVD